MKVFVAALFLLILATVSTFEGQPSESTCPCRATMNEQGDWAAGSEGTPRALSDLCHHPWGLSPSCMLSRYLETLPFVSSWAIVQILLGLGSSGKLGQGYVRSPKGEPLGREAKKVTEETTINVCDEEAGTRQVDENSLLALWESRRRVLGRWAEQSLGLSSEMKSLNLDAPSWHRLLGLSCSQKESQWDAHPSVPFGVSCPPSPPPSLDLKKVGGKEERG